MSKKEIPTDTEGKLAQLNQIEHKIADALKNAGTVISELGSDNVNEKKVMQFADKFLKGLDEVENELNRQLSYLGQVTCNTTHEGSVYGRVRENDHMLTATGSALLRSKHLMELTAPDKCPVPAHYKLHP